MPPLTDLQHEALATIDRLAGDPAFCLDTMLEPGDMVFLNSHTSYHARTEFEDHPEPERKRHLLRLWLSVPNSRPLPEGWSAIYRDRRPGAVRGGFPGHTAAPAYATALNRMVYSISGYRANLSSVAAQSSKPTMRL